MTETIEVIIEFEVAPASGPNPDNAPLELRFEGESRQSNVWPWLLRSCQEKVMPVCAFS